MMKQQNLGVVTGSSSGIHLKLILYRQPAFGYAEEQNIFFHSRSREQFGI